MRVYLAVDSQQQRQVAVKVFYATSGRTRRSFAELQAEARVAGALKHPNIVSVLDWGEDREADQVVAFLVTEYLAGGSLRAMIDHGVRLTPSQGLEVGLAGAGALAFAHRRGLVHRDVKPANLLFDDHGRPRLADFGIAHALAEASRTEPSGSLGGAARYSSPEAALGRRLDGAADVYALALVVVEAVTGGVPALGDTTAATLALRTGGDVMLDPDAAAAVGPLRGPLERALRLDPTDRPDAAELEIALLATAELSRDRRRCLWYRSGSRTDPGRRPPPRPYRDGEPRAATVPPPVPPGLVIPPVPPIPLEQIAADPHGWIAADPPTPEPVVFHDIALSRHAPLPTSHCPRSRVRRSPVRARKSGTATSSAVDTSTSSAVGTATSSETESAERSARSRRRWPWVVLVVLLLTGGLAAGWWFVIRTPTTEVPSLVGLDVAEATAAASRAQLRVDTSRQVRVDGSAPGDVVDQDPSAGAERAEDSVVRLTVSQGPTLVAPPAVAGMAEAEARAALSGVGLVPGASTSAVSETVPKGAVVSVAPGAAGPALDAQGMVPKGTTVDLVVSSGPAPRTVPDGLVGATQADAQTKLAAVQLVASASPDYSETVPAGTVITTNPSAGQQVARDSTVTLVVSQGPAPVPIPDVRGMPGPIAAAALTVAGFNVDRDRRATARVGARDRPARE